MKQNYVIGFNCDYFYTRKKILSIGNSFSAIKQIGNVSLRKKNNIECYKKKLITLLIILVYIRVELFVNSLF